jgi:hypothetical protein
MTGLVKESNEKSALEILFLRKKISLRGALKSDCDARHFKGARASSSRCDAEGVRKLFVISFCCDEPKKILVQRASSNTQYLV